MGQEKKEHLLKIYREQVFLSKSELARKAGISAATIDRIEKGEKCRLGTKKKIILALGLELSEAGKLFGDGESGESYPGKD
jgi:DNA-binding XRE family transcriptional regulator